MFNFIFLNELVRTVIVMSISGSVIALLLLLAKPLLRHRIPKTAQYCLWIVVLVSLLVPVSRFVVLPGAQTNMPIAPIHNIVERTVVTTFEDVNRQASISAVPAANIALPVQAEADVPAYDINPSLFSVVSTGFMLVYPGVVLVIMLYNMLAYIRFVKRLRRHHRPARAEERALLYNFKRHMNISRKVMICRNAYVATPMLIGLFKPIIILPDSEYTNTQLRSVLLHELTHLRRLDVVVKWLSLLACALRWFNPIVWIMQREIDRVCELSCDEAVIRNMNMADKRGYGETLISVASDTKAPRAVLSTTMCEEKRALKERLVAIKNSKRHTKLAVMVSVLVILLVALASCALGASGGDDNNLLTGSDIEIDDDAYTGDEVTQDNDHSAEDDTTQEEEDSHENDDSAGLTNDNEDTTSETQDASSETSQSNETTTTPTNNLVWVLEPTLEYEYIRLCHCGNFFAPEGAVDSQTGMLFDMVHGHGPGAPDWFYDIERGLFGHSGYGDGYHTLLGMHPLDEFEDILLNMFANQDGESWMYNQVRAWMIPNSNEFILVQAVDSSRRTYWDADSWPEGEAPGWWWLDEGAFSGMFALMYNRQFITDFIFTDGNLMRRNFANAHDFRFAAVQMGGSWGMVDVNGGIVLPFIFENLQLIDENTAFARVDGRYGILDIWGSVGG